MILGKEFIQALSATYMIDWRYGYNLAAMAHLVREGKVQWTKETFGLSRPDAESFAYTLSFPSATDSRIMEKVGVLEISGPIFRDSQFCGPMGSLDMADRIKGFDSDPDVKAIALKMFTPGGQVAGTEILTTTIMNTSKPVVAWGEEMLSGGAYIACGADSIWLSGKNAEVGSIGVQLSYHSFKEFFEKQGIKEFNIKATTSPDKNKFDWDNLTEEEQAQVAREILDPLDANFMEFVKERRPGVEESALTGNVYFAEEAISLGLADQIGTFEEAIQHALDMAGVDTHINSTEMTENNPAVTHIEEQPTNELAQAQARITELEEKVRAKNAAIIEHLATIEEQEVEIQTLKVENQRLRRLPAADPEAEVTAPAADAAVTISENKPAGEPLPKSLQAAVDAGQRRRDRHIIQGKIKTEE